MPRLLEAKKDVVSCDKPRGFNIDFLSSGERTGNSLNHNCYGNCGVVGLQYSNDCELECSGKFIHRE